MPIEFTTGDMLRHPDVTVFVIPTNCKGVMGAGLAKQAAERWPNIAKWQKIYGDQGHLKIGRLEHYSVESAVVICLPTKTDWREPSQLQYVNFGLRALARRLADYVPQVVAVPALGCGKGKLDWADVRPLIVATLGELGHRVIVFEPQGE